MTAHKCVAACRFCDIGNFTLLRSDRILYGFLGLAPMLPMIIAIAGLIFRRDEAQGAIVEERGGSLILAVLLFTFIF